MMGRCSSLFSSRRPSLPYQPSAGPIKEEEEEVGMEPSTSAQHIFFGSMRLKVPPKMALLVGSREGREEEEELAQVHKVLTESGWEVERAVDCRDGAKKTLFHPFNLVLLNLPRRRVRPALASGAVCQAESSIRAFVKEVGLSGGETGEVVLGALTERKLGVGVAEELAELNVVRITKGRGLWRLKEFLELLQRSVLPAQAKLRASSALFTAVDHTPIPIEITDADKNVQYVNSAYENVTGCLRSDVVGTYSSDLRRKSLPPSDPSSSAALESPASPPPWKCLPVSLPNSLSNRTDHFVYIRAAPGSKDCEETGRRHTMEVRRINGPLAPVRAPITEMMNLLKSVKDQNPHDPRLAEPLTQVMKILSTSELYTPMKARLKSEDKVSADLFDGLVRNGPGNGMGRAKNRKMSLSDAMRYNSQHPVFRLDAQGRSRSVSPDIAPSLLSQEHWNFDLLALERVSGSRPLSSLGSRVLEKWRVGEYLGCGEAKLGFWLSAMEAAYHPSNPYHNATHAADVLHATAYWLGKETVGGSLEHGDAVALLLGAIVHDLDHPGRGSAFLINTRHPLALLYNDVSVLESHHVSAAFQLTLTDARINIMNGLARPEFVTLRRNMVEIVLATDMAKHFEINAKFQQSVGPDSGRVASEPLEPAKRLSICSILIKCADISNPLRSWDVCREWAFRILEEYFRQTAEEGAKGLPLTMPVFDRPSCNIPQTQCSFIDMFARDMFKDWTKFADTQEMMIQLESNYGRWAAAASSWPASAESLGVPARLLNCDLHLPPLPSPLLLEDQS